MGAYAWHIQWQLVNASGPIVHPYDHGPLNGRRSYSYRQTNVKSSNQARWTLNRRIGSPAEV